MKTYCKPYGPYAIDLSLWLARVAGTKRGGGGEREKNAEGKREGSASPATLDAYYPGYTLAYSALGNLYFVVCKIRYTHSFIIPDYFVGPSAVEKLKSTVFFFFK